MCKLSGTARTSSSVWIIPITDLGRKFHVHLASTGHLLIIIKRMKKDLDSIEVRQAVILQASIFRRGKKIFDNIETCPEKYLLWFHHVPWDYKMKSGRTLWDELCVKYYQGTDYVEQMAKTWQSLKDKVDPEIFDHVTAKLNQQDN